MLKKGGKFVFAVDTVANRCPDDSDYRTAIAIKTKERYDLILKNKNYYDEKRIPSFLQVFMNYIKEQNCCNKKLWIFRHIYMNWDELEQHLQDIGFTSITVYSSYEKIIAKNNHTEMFLYECSF